MKPARFFYEACDPEEPQRDEGFNVENTDTAHETIEYKLKLGEVEMRIPTRGINVETFEYKNSD